MTTGTDINAPLDADLDDRATPGPGWLALIAMAVALMFLAGVIGWRIGHSDPERPSRDSVDVGFFQDMSTHHTQAITIGFNYLAHGTDPLLRQIAGEIITYQSAERGIMGEYLTQWGQLGTQTDTAMAWMGVATPRDRMPGLATPQQMTQLAGARGAALNDLFTRLVIEHHAGGVHMAEYAAREATNPEAIRWADSMNHGQRTEIGELNRWRAKNGLAPVDSGLD